MSYVGDRFSRLSFLPEVAQSSQPAKHPIAGAVQLGVNRKRPSDSLTSPHIVGDLSVAVDIWTD